MLGWAVGFLVAAVVAAAFGFGGVASAFTGLAVILFWIFLALFVLSLIFGRVRGGVGGGHTRGFNFGGAGLVALVAIVAIAVYAWIDNGMSAERAGRAIDREAAQLADAANDTISEVGVRTESLVTRSQEQIRSNAANGLDQASRNVDPDDGAQN